MAIKVGSVFYEVTDNIDETPMTLFSTWVVSCIRKDTVYLIDKMDGITWEKQGFGKNATFGWAKNIPHYLKAKFKTGERPERFSPTKRGAYLNRLRRVERYVRKYSARFNEDEAARYKKVIATLRSQYAKHKKAGN